MAKKGKKLSEEHKQKLALSKIGVLNPQFGKSPWNKGKNMSEEVRQKVITARAKQIITPEHKSKISLSMKRASLEGRVAKGENHYNWKGGITPEIRKIRNCRDMKLWREAVFKRDNYICQDCKVRGGNLQAHHIKPFAWFPELRLAIDNGVTLCKGCHKKYGTYQRKPNHIRVDVL